MKAVFTAGLAFTGNSAMGPILFDQSRLFPAGQPADEEPEPALPQGDYTRERFVAKSGMNRFFHRQDAKFAKPN